MALRDPIRSREVSIVTWSKSYDTGVVSSVEAEGIDRPLLKPYAMSHGSQGPGMELECQHYDMVQVVRGVVSWAQSRSGKELSVCKGL